MCCQTEIEDADQTFQPRYTDTWPTSPSTDPVTPGTWQGSHWNAKFEVTGMTRHRKRSTGNTGFKPWSAALCDVSKVITTHRRCQAWGTTDLKNSRCPQHTWKEHTWQQHTWQHHTWQQHTWQQHTWQQHTGQ